MNSNNILLGYEEFKREVKERVEQKIASGIEMYFYTTFKNNKNKVEVLTFREKGVNTVPMIHLKELYNAYLEVEDISYAIGLVLEAMETKGNIDFNRKKHNWSDVKEKIRMKLVNYTWNEEMFKEILHKRFLDLAVIFQVETIMENEIRVATAVKEHNLKGWGITAEELWKTAMDNLCKQNFKIKNMREIVFEIFEEQEQEQLPQYVVTNENNFLGAVCILRDDLLNEFSEKIQENFYIIPSSLHEVIFMPESCGLEKEYLDEMVQAVNQSCVKEDEWLSDHVYYYDRDKRELRM